MRFPTLVRLLVGALVVGGSLVAVLVMANAEYLLWTAAVLLGCLAAMMLVLEPELRGSYY
ncbi:hypothetical protein [Haloarchaeobius amylolyticus]|uniref:hypothetical protein n=1 Tax=Haloarchaeobius amylolyticus TaxID=1198296 RepID=UPI00226F1C4E|nr:hypothetical protein [Haloarchaeobius amylolyticus]